MRLAAHEENRWGWTKMRGKETSEEPSDIALVRTQEEDRFDVKHWRWRKGDGTWALSRTRVHTYDF